MINKAVVSVSCAVLVLFAFASTASAQTTTALYVDSQTGDPVGRGLNRTYLPPDATFSVSASTSPLYIYVSAPSTILEYHRGSTVGRLARTGNLPAGSGQLSPGPSPYLDVSGSGTAAALRPAGSRSASW